MSYLKTDLVKAIDTLKNTTKHVKTVKLKGNENEVIAFSADYVKAVEVALEVMREQLGKDVAE